jgi:hypothetical protein
MWRETFESQRTMIRPAQDLLDLANTPSDNTTDNTTDGAIGDLTGRCYLWCSGGYPAPFLPGHAGFGFADGNRRVRAQRLHQLPDRRGTPDDGQQPHPYLCLTKNRLQRQHRTLR